MKKEYRNSTRTRKMIREAFVELIGEKKLISAVTVAELAERADIAKSTFYNHYDDIYSVAEEFENELISEMSAVLDEIENDRATEYDVYIKKLIEFLKKNEDLYRRMINSAEIKFFLEKLKLIISKKVFEESTVIPFSQNSAERYTQIRFLTNACVDTMADYFRGMLDMTLDEVCEVILSFLNMARKSK